MKRVSVVFLLSIFIFTKFSFVSGNMVSDMVKVSEYPEQKKTYVTVKPSMDCFYDGRLMDSLVRHIKKEVRGKSCLVGGNEVEVRIDGVCFGAESGPLPIDGIGRLLTEVDCLKSVSFWVSRKTYSFHMKVSFNGDRIEFYIEPCQKSKLTKKQLSILNAEIRYLIEMVCSWLDIDEKRCSIYLSLYLWKDYSPTIEHLNILSSGLKNMIGFNLDGRLGWLFKKRVFNHLPIESIESIGLGYDKSVDDSLIKRIKSSSLRSLAIMSSKKVTGKGVNKVISNCPNLERLALYRCNKSVAFSNFLSIKNLKQISLFFQEERRNLDSINERLDFLEKKLDDLGVKVMFF